MKAQAIKTVLGKKIRQSQRFDEKGRMIPVTIIDVSPSVVVQVKEREKDGYKAVQLGFGSIKKIKKPILGHLKKAGINYKPRFLREVRVDQEEATLPKPGEILKVGEIFTKGDIVSVSGISKGKGFTGVVKRHHFAGGPRTHGQSDRERAPGSIGQTTTPGRVYKGKRMAGRSGGTKATIKNLKVIEVDNKSQRLVVSGLVPGSKNSLLTITKVI